MLYKKEFYNPRKYAINTRCLRKMEVNNSSENLLKAYWKYFCRRTTIHGLRYLTEEDLRTFEKIIWSIVLLIAIYGTLKVCIMASMKFNINYMATVIETTVFPIYQIPFPAVTICNANRINWARIREAESKFMPNASSKDLDLFRRFVARFEDFEFGNFDEFDEFENVSLTPLYHINISAMAEVMSFKCQDLFEGLCWWRNRELPCCDIFMQQRSEFGYCTAFNSLVNYEGQQMAMKDSNWPWRTSTSGDWSGLRATIRYNTSTKRPGYSKASGVLVAIHQPDEWPTTAVFVPMGTASTVLLKPKVSYAATDTRSVAPEIRECIFPDETAKTTYKSLPGFKYLIWNCISNCRQEYIVRYCNCTVEMFFPPSNHTSCTASDFHCLAGNDSIFNYEKVRDEERFINSTDEGMLCDCLHECYSIDYQVEVTPFTLARNESNRHRTFLQVHYHRNTVLKYRTNIVFGWLELLVAFGGIAGLFLGSSLLSGFELLYYMTIRLVVFMKTSFQGKLYNTQVNTKWAWKNSPNLIKKKKNKKNEVKVIKWSQNRY